MKKLAVLLAASAFATSAMAAETSNMTGFYVGANGGYGVGKTTAKNATAETKGTMALDGFLGGLHAGYQKDFGCLVAGLEGHGYLSNTKGSEVTSATDSLTAKRKHGLGVSGRFGAKLNSWLTYVKVGYDRAKFTSTEKENGVTLPSKSKNLNGLVLGLGAETMVSSNVALGAEITQTLYKGYTVKTAATNVKINNRVADFKLRLSYKF